MWLNSGVRRNPLTLCASCTAGAWSHPPTANHSVRRKAAGAWSVTLHRLFEAQILPTHFMKLLLLISSICATLLSFTAGCVSVDHTLWQPKPSAIEVKSTIVLKGDAFGSRKTTVPAGIYVFWKTDEYGYIYVSESLRFSWSEKVLGMDETSTFVGGFMLSNRMAKVIPVRIDRDLNNLHRGGELARYYLNKDLEKKGYFYGHAAMPLSIDECTKRGIVLIP